MYLINIIAQFKHWVLSIGRCSYSYSIYTLNDIYLGTVDDLNEASSLTNGNGYKWYEEK